jgi:hypothetical protein
MLKIYNKDSKSGKTESDLMCSLKDAINALLTLLVSQKN